MVVDYAEKNPSQRYRLMAQTIIPRPIAWIVTQNGSGLVNIAPFSYFTGLSSQPPTMVVSIGHKSDATPKDTLRNIRETKKCTVCMVDEAHLEAMHLSSKELAASESEAECFDIETKKLLEAFPPMVAGTPAAFFCTLHQEVVLEGSKTIPLILRIESQYIDDAIITDTEKITIEYAPVARVGRRYALLGKEIVPPAL